MMNVLREWYESNFSNPEAVILALLLLTGFFVVIFMGSMLAPLLASIVIAYLLEAIVGFVSRRGVPRLMAVLGVFFGFMVSLAFLILWLLPVLSTQISQLVRDLPHYIDEGQNLLLVVTEKFPQFIAEQQIIEVTALLRSEFSQLGQSLLKLSLASIPGLLALAVYLILVPLLVFFFLKDKIQIIAWLQRYLPQRRGLANQVWKEMDLQIGNYVRGKFVEIVIVGVVSYVVFAIMGLNYAMLLGALVGLSVIVPYIGAVVVTIPVALIAAFQWGIGPDFTYLMIAYLVIQALDGNVLVPLLFSEAVSLHPVAIIVAVLVFGGLWGFWGVFFAIPLATLVKAVLTAWPTAARTTAPISS